MSEIETALALRLEASLARFERQMQRAVQVGGDSATRLQDRFTKMGDRVARSAEDSAGTMAREFDRLRTKFDPLFAASQRYEAALNELNQAQRVGAITGAQHEAALERLNSEYAQTAVAAQTAGNAMMAQGTAARGLAGAIGRNSHTISNVSNQVADFAVQVAMGTDASRAFAQQAPQMLGAFGMSGGLFGALAGAMGAVVAIGVPLIAMMASSGAETQTLQDRLDALRTAVDDYASAARDARVPTAELAARYGSATGAAREFLGALQEINRTAAMGELRGALTTIRDTFGGFGADMVDEFTGVSYAVDAIRDRMGDMNGLVEVFGARLQSLGDAASPDQAVEAARALLNLLERGLGPYEAMSAEAQELYRNIRDAGERAAVLKGAAEGAGSAIGGAASQASRLADEMGRAVSAAMELATAGVTDVRRAQIELEYMDDPVGRAAALAGADFDARTAPLQGADPTLQAVRERNRRQAVESAAEVARLNEELRRRREAQREASSGTGTGSGAGRAAPEDGLFARSDAELASLEAQLQMIGRTAAQTAELTTRQGLLNEARRRGLDLAERSTETGETLAEQIDRQAAAVGRLVAAQEQANESASFFGDIQQDLKDSILDAAVAGESLSGSLANVARALARAALEAALFNSGPMAAMFGGQRQGGGLLGGLVGSLFGGRSFGGFFAEGGTLGAGQWGIAGENGPEPVIGPAQIVSNKQAFGGGSAKVDVVLHLPEGVTMRDVETTAAGVAVRVVGRAMAGQRRMLPGQLTEYDNRGV